MKIGVLVSILLLTILFANTPTYKDGYKEGFNFSSKSTFKEKTLKDLEKLYLASDKDKVYAFSELKIKTELVCNNVSSFLIDVNKKVSDNYKQGFYEGCVEGLITR